MTSEIRSKLPKVFDIAGVRIKTSILMTALVTVLLTSGCMRFTEHPSLRTSSDPCGYIEFFYSAGWLGQPGKILGQHKLYTGNDYLGNLFAPQYPWECSDWSLATSIWYKRIALPLGENEITVVQGTERKKLKFTVYQNRVTLVRLESERVYSEGKFQYFRPTKVFVANVTLQKPANPGRVDADPESYDALIELLREGDWGLRDYALRRLKLLNDQRALPHLENAYSTEDNPALKGDFRTVIEQLKSKSR
jgi:hypothetical protein